MQTIRYWAVLSAVVAPTFFSISAVGEDLRLTLPPNTFAVAGQPLAIVYDNLVLTQTPESFRFRFSLERDGKPVNSGTHEPRWWKFTPASDDVGDSILRVQLRDGSDRLMATAETTLHVSAADSGSDRELRLLIVGDSLTHGTIYPNELAKLLSASGNPRWTMLGTHRPPSAAVGVAHEGYGGWTWEAFASRFADNPNLEKKLRSSPFVFPDETGKPQLNPARYFDENAGGKPPDVVFFLLGINDCFAAPADDPEKLDQRIDIVLKHAETLLTAIRRDAPRADLAVGLTTPPNALQAAFTANYQDKYPRWGWKRIQHRLVEREIKQFSGREREGVFLVPCELTVDPVDGYPPNNAVHPNPTGYRQIAESVYAWLKWRLANSK